MGSALTCVCVCFGPHAIVSPSLLSNDTGGTWSENGQTNTDTHTLSLSLSISHTHTHTYTHTHTGEATGMLCCIVGEGALSGSRPLDGTLERPNSGAPTRRGGGGVRKPRASQWPPTGWLSVCVRERLVASRWFIRVWNQRCICLSPVSRQVLDQDNFSPIPVSTEDEYKHYTSQFPMQDPDLDKVETERTNEQHVKERKTPPSGRFSFVNVVRTKKMKQKGLKMNMNKSRHENIKRSWNNICFSWNFKKILKLKCQVKQIMKFIFPGKKRNHEINKNMSWNQPLFFGMKCTKNHEI